MVIPLKSRLLPEEGVLESKTGVYKYNPETKKVEKVSDNPSGLKTEVYFPKGSSHSGHHFEHLDDKTFYSKEEKRNYMKEHNIVEAG